MRNQKKTLAATALAISLGLGLAACAGQPTNRSLYSTKQPVVERQSYTFDVQTNGSGLSIPEQKRLSDWFEVMNLRYGDRVAIDDPVASPATKTAIADLAARHGLLLAEGAPVTAGALQPGTARVVVTRSTASVPGCPDWSEKMTWNYNNATNEGFGCAVNGNYAAMIANPEHLLKGEEGTGESVVMSSSKAIRTFRNQAPTGQGGLAAESSKGS
jgi:pilus assembly protein CpaD